MVQPITPQTIAPKSILVVDDEPPVAEILRLLLTLRRHQVDVAASAEQALALFAQGTYDLVITDFALPHMDGLTLARRIRERFPNLPIILISGLLEEIQGGHLDRSCVDYLLAKPFSPQHLEEALAKVLSNH